MINYREHPAINQSHLKDILKGLGEVKKKKTGNHFKIGDAVDILLTQSQEVFDNTYIVLSNYPSDKLIEVAERYLETDDLQQSIIDCKYYTNRKIETNITKFENEARDYFNLRVTEPSKKIISQIQYNLVINIVYSFLNSEYTKKYFEGILLKQLAIYFNYDDVECKALLDMVQVDDYNKTLQPIDIKTTGDSTIVFKYSAKKFRYDIQSSFYTKALESYRDIYYPGYTILPFLFIVETTKEKSVGYPLVYQCTPYDLHIGEFGRQEIHHTKGKPSFYTTRIKGFKEAIQMQKEYVKNNYSKDFRIQQGKINLNLWEDE